MSTDKELIEQAQRDVKPRDILMHSVGGIGSIIPLDCGSLKRLVSYQHGKRPITWEEWLDIRDGWCRCFRAAYIDCTRHDTMGIQLAAQRAEREGMTYLLIDYI